MLDKMNHTIIDSDELAELVSERDRMKAALQFIADCKWVATMFEHPKWINQFCDVATKALGEEIA